MRISSKPSPNSSPRNGAEVLAVVLHYDASMSSSGAISWMRNPQSRVSAHFHIGRDGAVTQMVELSRAAWQAGVASIPLPDHSFQSSATNEHSIGIEISNSGLLHRDDNGLIWFHDGDSEIPVSGKIEHAALLWPSGMRLEGWWVPFTPPQLDALTELLAYIASKGYSVAVKNLVGHDEIAKPDGRKQDPGPLFPWEMFSRACPRVLKSVIL